MPIGHSDANQRLSDFHPIPFSPALRPMLNLFYVIAAAVLVLAESAAAAETVAGKPFRVGEQFTYEISWLNILAGTAVMEVQDGGRAGTHALAKFVTTAQSRPAITKFFPVDNRVASDFDLQAMLPQHMLFKRREGKKKEDIEYTFHHAEQTVTAVRGGETETLAIQPNTQDLISCLYYVRSQLPLKPGESIMLNIHHDKKNRTIEVRVEEIEQVDAPWGKVDAARVLVVMPFHGIFMNQGNIKVWFTTDEHRIPVRMKAKVVIGSIVADLVNGYQALKGSP